MEKPNLCKDCKHCAPGRVLFIRCWSASRCKKSPYESSLISGKIPGYYLCTTIRHCHTDCKMFEKKGKQK